VDRHVEIRPHAPNVLHWHVAGYQDSAGSNSKGARLKATLIRVRTGNGPTNQNAHHVWPLSNNQAQRVDYILMGLWANPLS
jgi:hypothetical protein